MDTSLKQDETGKNAQAPILPAVKQALLDMVDKNAYMKRLKIELLDIQKGFIKSRLWVTQEVLNPYGSVHGGCLYSLADITAGLAASTYNVYSSTIDGHMEYVLPAMNTEFIICEAREIHQGLHVSLYEAWLYDDKNQLVDKAGFTFYMMRRSIVPEEESKGRF